MHPVGPLTRYPEGSIRELWSISLPLMISIFASLCMIFTDRIFLSHYSLAALNASVTAGTLAWAFVGGMSLLTSMSEIFVAQYNGAKEYSYLGVPVWQMVWVSLFSFVFFIPLAIWGAPWLFANQIDGELSTEMFRWLMVFGPSCALMTAFSGFFIGRGKTKMLVWLAIGANLVNIGLDRAFIFGIPGMIPEMGVRGAAIATFMGYLFEALILAAIFLRKKNRELYGTGRFQIRWPELKKCFRIGFPQGIFYGLEILGWAIFYNLMTQMSEVHITISSICQSLLILFSFFYDGLSRGATAIAGNLIGAKKHDLVHKVLRSGVFLLCFFNLLIGLSLFFNVESLIHQIFFIETASEMQLQGILRTCLFCSFAYLLFEGIRWLVAGLLVAAGDTFFLLISGSLSVWFFLLLPIYILVVRDERSVEYAWALAALYSALLFFIYWSRFKWGPWKKIDLVKDVATDRTEENTFEE